MMRANRFSTGLPRTLQVYIALVAFSGAAWTLYLIQGVEWTPATLGKMGLFTLLIVAAGSFPLHGGPRVKTDVASAALFAAALLLEPGPAALTAAAGVVTYGLIPS